MLVRFFKDGRDLAVQCQVIKYCDRIWIENVRETAVFREFFLEVAAGSPPLHEIRMLVPRSVIGRPEDLNHTWGDPEYPFNQRFLGGKLSLEKMAQERKPGLIRADGINEVKFFSKCFISARDIVEDRFSIIRIEFPEAVTGRVGLRFVFRVANLLRDLYPGVVEPIHAFGLSYFSQDLYNRYCNGVGRPSRAGVDDEVPALMVYDTERPGYPGGFDIFVVLPAGYDAIHVSGSEERQTEDYGSDGKTAIKPRLKLAWRMRLLDADKFARRDLSLTCGDEHHIRGEIFRKGIEAQTITEEIDDLSQRLGMVREEFLGNLTRIGVTLDHLTEQTVFDRRLSRTGIILAIVALAIQIIEVVLALIPPRALNREFSSLISVLFR